MVESIVNDYRISFTVFLSQSSILFTSSGNTEVYFINYFDENFLAYYVRSIRSKGIIQSRVVHRKGVTEILNGTLFLFRGLMFEKIIKELSKNFVSMLYVIRFLISHINTVPKYYG